MDRDELVERVAEAIFIESGTARLQSWERYRAFYHERGVLSPDYYAQARAALAIIEPAVREECARVCEVHAPKGLQHGLSYAAAILARKP